MRLLKILSKNPQIAGFFVFGTLGVNHAMLLLLDIFLCFLHLSIIGFNLTGWIWKRTRRLHLMVVGLTAFSWLVMGLWKGIGYCPITDWEWQVKAQRGITDLPHSFITWLLETMTGARIPDQLVDTATAITFGVVAVLSIYFNFLRPYFMQNR